MLKRLLEVIRLQGASGKKMLVAASGGMDSTVLLDMLIRTNCPIAIAHANFQLRGQASDGDEAWVAAWANKHQVPFFSRRFDTNNYASEKGLSIQMAARELRYAWFEELAAAEGYELVAMAHHLNDQLETFLINVVRGTGLAGLTGISERNGRIFRPMLNFNHKEIEQYAAQHKLKWREDATNAEDDYSRNFIRHQVVPKLLELNPSLEETFRRNLERLGAADEMMNHALQNLRQQHVVSQGAGAHIDKQVIESWENPAPVLLELIKQYGFNLDQCRDIVRAASGQPGTRFLTTTHQLVIDRNLFIVVPHAGSWTEVTIPLGATSAVLGPWQLAWADSSSTDIHPDQNIAVLAADQLKFPLIWRKWRAGDYFFPLGMAHRKKLSDFLVDNKISVAEKDILTVLVSGGEIAWVVGHRIDNRFRIHDDTQNAWVFQLKHI